MYTESSIETIKDSQYLELGKLAKEKILNRIKSENILIEKTFKMSLLHNYCYQQAMKRVVGERDLAFYHKIIIPQFTDDIDIIQAFKLAHELGHYYLFKKCKRTWKYGVLKSSFPIATYISEKMAWQEALNILKNEYIITDDKNDIQAKIDIDFQHVKEQGLRGYRKNIFSLLQLPIFSLLKTLIYTYFFASAAWVIDKTGVPFPISFDLDKNSFRTLSQSIFGLMLITNLLIYLYKSKKRN